MFHAHAEAQNRRCLKDKKKSDRGDQTAERIVAQRPEQGAFHHQTQQTDKDEPRHDRKQKRHFEAGIEIDHAIGADHVELAMGEVYDAHYAEDQNQADRDQRHIACRIGRVRNGLKEELHAAPVDPFVKPGPNDFGPGSG